MKVSFMSPIVYAGSSVTDEAFTMSDLVTGSGANCRARELSKGMEIQVGTEIFEYQHADKIIPQFDANNENYSIGDIVLKNCKIYKITGKSGLPSYEATRPKEPEEYGAYDNILNFETASHRYFRVHNKSATNICMGSIGMHRNRWYYLHKEKGAWIFTAKDLTAPYCLSGDPRVYLRSNLKNATTYKFDASKDFKATITSWCYSNCVKQKTLSLKNMIIRGEYAYFRTPLDLPIEYVSLGTVASTITYALTECITPMDIPGFIYKRNIAALSVFDNKDYTKCEAYPEEGWSQWRFYNTEHFDCIAFSQVIADTIDIKIASLVENTPLWAIKNYPIQNSLSTDRFEQAVTSVLYTKEPITTDALIETTLNGNYVSLGDLSVGYTIDMGYTRLEFSNDLNDYSPYEKDQWGNITYVDGIKVKTYTGTVDLLIKDYDMIQRSMNMIAGNEVIINGSDSINNTPTNSISIFQSTMIVGRFTELRLKTSSKNKNKIDDIATYTFEIEERV